MGKFEQRGQEDRRNPLSRFSSCPLALLVKKAAAILLLPFLLLACADKDEVYRQESFVFGTRVELSVAGTDKARAEAAMQAVLQRFDQLHRKLHAWQPSELQALNTAFAAGRKAPLDAELAAILADAKHYASQGDNLFNPAIGQLIALWGFHADLPQSRIPDAAAVSRLVKAAPSLRDVHVENALAWSDNPAVQLDLGGYAKGYALDQAAAILRQHGIRDALINIGGNVMALGRHGERAWKVGIQQPRGPGVIASLELRDGEAIGTSGDYQRYFEAGGQRYCHLIDPRTGFPARTMQSVTVLVSGAQAGVKSDVLSKPLFIVGTNGLSAMKQRLGVSQLLAITADGSLLVTPEMAGRLQWSAAKPALQQLR